MAVPVSVWRSSSLSIYITRLLKIFLIFFFGIITLNPRVLYRSSQPEIIFAARYGATIVLFAHSRNSRSKRLVVK